MAAPCSCYSWLLQLAVEKLWSALHWSLIFSPFQHKHAWKMPLSSYKGSISGTVGRFQFRSRGVFSGWRDLTIEFVLSDVVEVVHIQEQLKEALSQVSRNTYGSKKVSIAKILLKQTLPGSVIYPVSGDIIVIGGCSNATKMGIHKCFGFIKLL